MAKIGMIMIPLSMASYRYAVINSRQTSWLVSVYTFDWLLREDDRIVLEIPPSNSLCVHATAEKSASKPVLADLEFSHTKTKGKFQIFIIVHIPFR